MTDSELIDQIKEYVHALPPKGSIWLHHSGRLYEVDRVTNLATIQDRDPVRQLKFPVMVTYFTVGHRLEAEEWFSRPVDEFWSSFQRAP